MSTNTVGLVSSVSYSALARHDLRIAEVFRRSFTEPTDSCVKAQIAAANSFWQLKLGQVCNADSIAAREALIVCELEDWIRLFTTYIAPRVVRLNIEF